MKLKPKKGPTCCGQDAVWTSISPRIEYWYCKACKNEVLINDQNKKSLELDPYDVDVTVTYPGLFYTPSKK